MTESGQSKNKTRSLGFSLSELLIAILIAGILSSIALPKYFNQVKKTRQNQAAATVSQIQTTIAAFVDEVGLLPTSWNDLNQITPLMTPEGPANQSDFAWISVASDGCTESVQANCYQMKASRKDYVFTLQARPSDQNAKQFNVVACLDLRSGSSDLRKGTQRSRASITDLRCVRHDS